MSYSSLRDKQAQIVEFMNQFNINDDAAGFIYYCTNLFQDHNDQKFEPYSKQVHFMNCLKKQDRIIQVLKPRQCKVGNTFINTNDGIFTIKELFEKNYNGHCYSFSSNEIKDDKVVDIWACGIKDVYEITTFSGHKITCTKEDRINTIDGFKTVKDLSEFIELIIPSFSFSDKTISCFELDEIIESNNHSDLPQIVMDLDEKYTRALLIQLINKYQKKASKNEVCIKSSNLKFISQIKFLLDKINIYSSIKISYQLNKKHILAINYSLDCSDNRIKSIKYVGKEQTYDLTTQKYSSFIANGIHVHNSGFSTAVVGRAVFEAIYNKVPEIAIVSATRPQAEKVLDRMKKAIRSMHESIRPILVTENKSQLEFSSGLKVYSLSSNPDAMRGLTGTVYLDEFAMLTERLSEEVYTALYPMITKGGKVVIVSTPKGKRNMFYKLYANEIGAALKADRKLNKVIYEINWQDVPHVKYAVEHEGLFEGLTDEMIDQEYRLTFVDQADEALFKYELLFDKFIDKKTENDREADLPLFTNYIDMGIPMQYFDDLDKPMADEFRLINNSSFNNISKTYSRFFGGWDIASTNDDSIVAIMGQRRDNPNRSDIIGEYYVKEISEDIIKQAKYIVRVLEFFGVDKFVGDYKGLGRGAVDYLCGIDTIGDSIVKFEADTQSTIDGMRLLRTIIEDGNLKRRYDDSKQDKRSLTQMQNIYMIGGKVVGKNGKHDYPYALMHAFYHDEYKETKVTILGQENFTRANNGLYLPNRGVNIISDSRNPALRLQL